MIDAVFEFSRAMVAAGLEPVKHSVVADGRIHRFRVSGDRAGKENGWYVLYTDGIPAGAFGSWKTSEQHSWCAKSGNELTPDEREANNQRMEAAKKARDDELEEIRAQARIKAHKLLKKCKPGIDADNQYIKDKGITPYMADQLGKSIVLTACDDNFEIQTLQFILPDGQKRFLTGGKKKGCFFYIESSDWHRVLVCEGWATACSLHEATGETVVVCFDSGNILPVCQALLKQPAISADNLIICADDDFKTIEPIVNPGITKASEAAEKIGARMVMPQFDKDRPDWATDFNDVHKLYGLDAVRQCVAGGGSKVVDLSEKRAEKVGAKQDEESKNKPPADNKKKDIDWKRLDSIIERYALIYGTDTCYDTVDRLIMKVSALRLAIPDYCNLWLKSSRRRTIRQDELVFDPTQECKESCLNLFDGFEMKPKAGNFAPIIELLHHLCADSAESDEGIYEVMNWVLKWLALPLQRPGTKMRSALVFHGPQGTGKNLFFEVIAAIYGRYALVVGQSELEEKYNDWMSQKLFLIGDEVIAKQELYDHKNKLKTFITGITVHIHGKFLPLRSEKNHINVVFLSNEDQPLALEPSDRRYFVVYTPPQRMDGLYQEVAECIKNGGVEAFYDHLMNLDLDDFSEFSKPVMTTAKKDLIQLGLRPAQRFAYEWVSGQIPLPLAGCSAEQLFDAFRYWSERNGERWSPNKSNFSSQLLKATEILKPSDSGNYQIERKKVRLPFSRNGKTFMTMWIPAGFGPKNDQTLGEWAVDAERVFDDALQKFKNKSDYDV